jgi:L-asparaginase II
MVAGTDRFDTNLMQVLRERAFVKSGAEGVYCAALPELGCGIALKIDDGTPRASAAAMATLILHLLPLSDWERTEVEALARPMLKNWNGLEVGRVQPNPDFFQSVTTQHGS